MVFKSKAKQWWKDQDSVWEIKIVLWYVKDGTLLLLVVFIYLNVKINSKSEERIWSIYNIQGVTKKTLWKVFLFLVPFTFPFDTFLLISPNHFTNCSHGWKVQSEVEWLLGQCYQEVFKPEKWGGVLWCDPGQLWQEAGLCSQGGVIIMQWLLQDNSPKQ